MANPNLKLAFFTILRRAVWAMRRRTGRVSAEYIPKPLILPYLPESSIVVDCGANDGSDTADLARLLPSATIHAFEPVPAVFDKLVQNTKGFSNVRPHRLALADRDGTAAMHISSGGTDAASSLLPPKESLALNPHIVFEETCEVPCFTLDTWAEAHDCPRVDLLWLDMQGSELAMLKAAPDTLATVSVIHLEVVSTEVYAGNPMMPEVETWLKNQGFRRKFLAVDHAGSGNAVFVRY